MKIKNYFVFVSCLVLGTAKAENPIFEEAMLKVKSEPSVTNIMNLAGHLRGAARNLSSLESLNEFHRMQNTLLAIPGFTQYFVTAIERERGVPKPGVYPLGDDRKRWWHFETLSHLPSPETVKVLGDFLQDERDFELAVWKDYGGEVHSSGGRSPNCNHAGEALGALGLRNPPYAKGEFMEDVGKWRVWWEDIKAGKRAFSFTGQSVEYRFNPDGTWETKALENPPDDSPRAITPGISRENRIQPKPQVPTELAKHHSDPRHPWLCWIAGILILALCGGWFWLKKTQS